MSDTKPNGPIPPDPNNPNPIPNPNPPIPAVDVTMHSDAGPVAQHVIRDLRQLLQNARELQAESDDLLTRYKAKLAERG